MKRGDKIASFLFSWQVHKSSFLCIYNWNHGGQIHGKYRITISFGKEPYSVISRSKELEEIYNSFSSDRPESDAYILSGVRGSGKTVAMQSIAEFYKKQDKWIVVELNPIGDMLAQLLTKLYDEGKLRKLFLKTEFNFSFKGFGFSIHGDEPLTNISSLLAKEFEYLTKKLPHTDNRR